MTNSTDSRRFRRVWYIIAALAMLAFFSTLAGASRAEAAQATDWTITSGNSQENVEPGVKNYRLYNRSNKKAVVYGEREYGINLVWGSPTGSANIRFERKSGTGALEYDTPVAIHVADGGYLRYEERRYGINLVWSSTPVYQWRIRGGEGVIKVGAPLSIYNTFEGDYLVYGERTWGINLRWLKDIGGAAPTQIGGISVGFRMSTYDRPLPCTGNLVWRLSPVSLTGSEGTATPVTIDRTFDQYSRIVGPNQYACDFLASAGGLRPGSWRVQLLQGDLAQSCVVTVRAGVNGSAYFTEGRPDCSVTGFVWP